MLVPVRSVMLTGCSGALALDVVELEVRPYRSVAGPSKKERNADCDVIEVVVCELDYLSNGSGIERERRKEHAL